MTKPINDGGPVIANGMLGPISHLTVRDFFAAAALTGLISKGETSTATNAMWAYQMADAMLEARKT